MTPLELEDLITFTIQGKTHTITVRATIDDHFSAIVDMIEGEEIELTDAAYEYYNSKYEIVAWG